MDMNAWEAFKDSEDTNVLEWLREAPIVSYGVVTRVVDAQTVEVDELVQESKANKRSFTVTLLSLSSALLEIHVQPQLNDQVLLLFLRRYDPHMFDSPEGREEPTLLRPQASGYTRFSGCGILMSALKLSAAVVVSVAGGKGNAAVKADVQASVTAEFRKALTLAFVSTAGDDAEHPVYVLYGDRQPHTREHWSKVHRRYGMRELPDGSLEKLDAAVSEEYSVHAPISKDIQGVQTYSVGLGKDKDGNPVETDAPITEVIHGKAPVVRDIRSPQKITVGIGNEESGDSGEPRHAPLTVVFGEDADIDFTSGSGITASIKKNVDVGIDGNDVRRVGGDREESVTGKAKYTSADTDIESTAPVGINDGLYKTGLKPYLNAETAAVKALSQAASGANPQLAILDAVSGGTGFVTGLGAAIVAFCTAVEAADTAAHTSISKAVK